MPGSAWKAYVRVCTLQLLGATYDDRSPDGYDQDSLLWRLLEQGARTVTIIALISPKSLHACSA